MDLVLVPKLSGIAHTLPTKSESPLRLARMEEEKRGGVQKQQKAKERRTNLREAALCA